MFKTLVGSAATSELFSPSELTTASPVGNPWKKLGTPDATHEGRAEPNPDRMLLTSDSTSLRMSLCTTGEGSLWTGDGVMTGLGGATLTLTLTLLISLQKAVGAGEAKAIEATDRSDTRDTSVTGADAWRANMADLIDREIMSMARRSESPDLNDDTKQAGQVPAYEIKLTVNRENNNNGRKHGNQTDRPSSGSTDVTSVRLLATEKKGSMNSLPLY